MNRKLFWRLMAVILGLSSVLFWLGQFSQVFAHEAYVLTADQFHQGLLTTNPQPLVPLFDRSHMMISALITISVIGIYGATIFFASTNAAVTWDRQVKRLQAWVPVIIRITVGIALLYAARSNVILGPELPLTSIAGGAIIRYLLFLTALLLIFGVLTELAAVIDLIILCLLTLTFKAYLITYANYFADFFVLALFGARFFSADRLFLGPKLWLPQLEKWRDLEMPLVRIFYGAALVYAGWNVKFLHQAIAVHVYNQYHLGNYFHAAASFIAAGAGLSEIAVGLFIALGFCLRLTVIISLMFITLSLLYFQEMLWPHLVLYGISFALLINAGDKLTIDRYLAPWVRSIRRRLL